ncbi:MAG: hypothetical protein MJZ93_03715 [Paludibacteraceae bacterium]|nr:hypothetical protein [Paludibacteraceae bacterium]
MKKVIFFASLLMLVAVSCRDNTKSQEAKKALEDFNILMIENCDNWSDSQWEIAQQRYENICANINEYSYTDAEMESIERIKKDCGLKFKSHNIQTKIEDAVDDGKNFIERIIEKF